MLCLDPSCGGQCVAISTAIEDDLYVGQKRVSRIIKYYQCTKCFKHYQTSNPLPEE